MFNCQTWICRWAKASALLLTLVLATLQDSRSACGLQAELENEPRFMRNAIWHFHWRAEHAGTRSLLLNALDDEKAFEKFSLDWYAPLVAPKHFLKIGVGFTYQAKDYTGPTISLGTAPEQAGSRGTGASELSATLNLEPDPNATIVTGVNESGVNVPAPGASPSAFLDTFGGPLALGLVERLTERAKQDSSNFGKVLAYAAGFQLDPEDDTPPPAAAETSAPETENTQASQGAPGAMTMGIRPRGPLGSEGSGNGRAGPTRGNDGGSKRGGSRRDSDEEKKAAVKKKAEEEEEEETPSPDGRPKREANEFNTIAPGIVCLNEGKREEILKRAREEGCDVVFAFEILVKEKDDGTHYSMTTLKVIPVDPPAAAKDAAEKVIQTKALRHDLNKNERDEKTGKNVIDVELDKVIAEFEALYLSKPLPALKPEHVDKRVAKILQSVNDQNRLETAVEIMGFFRLGLLDSTKAIAAFDKVFPGGGAVLVNGPADKRTEFLSKIDREIRASR